MDLMATAQEQHALDEAVRRLVEALRPERIYLFGSQARGDADEDSDYDLMVVLAEPDGSRYEHEVAAYGALWGVPIATDILVWTRDEFRAAGAGPRLPPCHRASRRPPAVCNAGVNRFGSRRNGSRRRPRIWRAPNCC
jgi:hypothetical protein